MILTTTLLLLAPAQEPFPLAVDLSAHPVPEPTSVRFLEGAGRAQAAIGKAYVAELGRDQFVYAVRGAAETSKPLKVGLRLRSAESGGRALALERGAAAQRDAGGLAIQRGGVVERYRMDLEEVEQTFVFTEPTDDALAVTVDVETELDIVHRGQETYFMEADQGIRMGAAFAVDAAGRRLALDTVFDGPSYRIEVPASFTSRATFPVTIDPILTSFVIDDLDLDLRNPQVAYDSASDTFVAVYEELDFNSYAIYMRRFDRAGTILDQDYIFTSPTGRLRAPGIASGGTNGKALIAVIADQGPGTPSAVVSRLLDVPTFTADPLVTVSTSSAGQPFSELTMGGCQWGWYFVAWTVERSPNDHDILSRIVVSNGSLPPGGTIVLAGGPEDTIRPHVPKCSGSRDDTHSTWPCVYQIANGGGSLDRIGVTELNIGGNMRHTTHLFAQPGARPLISPPLAGSGPRVHMVVFQDEVLSHDRMVVGRLIDGVAEVEAELLPPRIPGLGGASDLTAHAIGCNGERFCLSWSDDAPGGRRTFLSTFGYLEFSSGVFNFRGSEDFPVHAPDVLTTDITAAGPGGDYVSVHEVIGSDGTYDVGAFLYDDGEDPVGSKYCQFNVPNSTGYPAFMRLQGSPVVGEPLRLVAEDLPPNTFGMFVVGTQAVPPAGTPSSQGLLCIGGDLGRFVNGIQNSGPAGWISLDIDTSNLPLNPMRPAVAGQPYVFQAWYRDANPTPTSNFSDAMRYVAE